MGVIAAAITFMFLNLDSLYRPVANCSLVPLHDIHLLGDRKFVAVVWDAEAVTQVTGSFSLNRRALH